MKSIFEEMGGTYRQVGDYLIPTSPCQIPAIIRSANTGICAAVT